MRLTALAACAALFAATLHAQSFATHPCSDNSDHGGILARWLNGEQACEVRSATVPLVNGHLNLYGENGSIEVLGQDRPDIALEARITAHAGSKAAAESLLHEVTIETGATIEDKGPHVSGNQGWSVSYHLLVPHRLAATFRTMNGSLSLTALNGAIDGETTNGSLHFENLAGDVHLSTTNGSIHATLDGNTWQGTALRASTINGGVSVSVPHPYSAHLVASTVNGGISLDVPGANSSSVHHNSIDTNLGSGGPTLSFQAVNGGISIK